MKPIAIPSNRQKLADAALSLKAVRKYQRDRRFYGAKRVHLYFDDVDGDWLKQFNDEESNEGEEHHLSKDICEV